MLCRTMPCTYIFCLYMAWGLPMSCLQHQLTSADVSSPVHCVYISPNGCAICTVEVELCRCHVDGVTDRNMSTFASQGRIASFMCGDEPLGPPRVWLRDVNVPGLCMTRSFGDLVAASVGVIDEPQVITSNLRPEDK